MRDFGEIYNIYMKDVYKYVLAISRNPDVAEEITQETFFKALKGFIVRKCLVAPYSHTLTVVFKAGCFVKRDM